MDDEEGCEIIAVIIFIFKRVEYYTLSYGLILDSFLFVSNYKCRSPPFYQFAKKTN